MESQPQNPEFRINHENFHPCMYGHGSENEKCYISEIPPKSSRLFLSYFKRTQT